MKDLKLQAPLILLRKTMVILKLRLEEDLKVINKQNGLPITENPWDRGVKGQMTWVIPVIIIMYFN